ncbi:hypothetical protein J3A83DRAFT_2574499 [Scleroderma citrinum]
MSDHEQGRLITAEDHPPPYSDSSPPKWEPQFEDLTAGRLSMMGRNPLDPPPECFSAPSPLRVRSRDFPPFRIPSLSDKLVDGFRVLYPRDLLEKHGITREDWTRFLEDLTIAARLSTQGLSAVGSRVPVKLLPARGPFITRLPGAAYDAAFQKSPLEEVKALITIWNECAFERRRLRVSPQVLVERGEKVGYDLVVESL